MNGLDQLAARLGPKGFTADAEMLAPYLSDWRGIYHGRAQAMVSPATVEEVQAVIAFARDHFIPIVPQGGNSGMVGGATPDESGTALLLSLRRMNAIRSIDAESGQAVVEAGVILETLHEAARAAGRRFPLTLGARGSATIGGLVSTNAGGTQVLRFGTMRKLVLGIEAVLPDGSVHDRLAVLKKDNRGYDLTQLLIGAEGTLGVVTAATLRIVPDVLDSAVAWIGVASPQDALRLLRVLEAETGEAIESFEIVPDSALRLVVAHLPGARAPLEGQHPWHVLIELVRTSSQQPEPVSQLEAALERQMNRGLISDAVIASNGTQAAAFWRLRDSISEAERAAGPAVQHDISVPVEAMPDFMLSAAAAVEAEFPGVECSAFGHLGDGNVHFHVRAPAGVDASEWRSVVGAAASHRVYDLVTAAGGSLSAEHGIGQMKRNELVRQSDPARIAFLQAIKQAIDPQGIMNPGKLVPLAPARMSA